MNRDNPHIEKVIIAYAHRGTGIVGDPHRKVLQVFRPSGEMLAERDHWMENGGAADIALHLQRLKEAGDRNSQLEAQLQELLTAFDASRNEPIRLKKDIATAVVNYVAKLKRGKKPPLRELTRAIEKRIGDLEHLATGGKKE